MMTEVDIANPTLEISPAKTTRPAHQLPQPKGYKILIALPQASDETDGLHGTSIIKAEETKELEEVASPVGYVVSMGPDCYKDLKRFPSGAWCKEGDWIILRPFSGTRILVHGQEFRLINDDSVEATVEDPQGITRA